MNSTSQIHQTLRDSAGIRWMVLLFLAFAMFCSYIFMDILSRCPFWSSDACGSCYKLVCCNREFSR